MEAINTINLKGNIFVTIGTAIPAKAKLKMATLMPFMSEEDCQNYVAERENGFENYVSRRKVFSAKSSLQSAIRSMVADPERSVSDVRFKIYTLN